MLKLLRGGDPAAEVVCERDRGVKTPTPTQHSLVHHTHMPRRMTASPATSYSPGPRYAHARTHTLPHTHTHTHTHKHSFTLTYTHTPHAHKHTRTNTHTWAAPILTYARTHIFSLILTNPNAHQHTRCDSEWGTRHACMRSLALFFDIFRNMLQHQKGTLFTL